MNLEELNTNLEKVNFSLIQKENELKDQQINIFILNKNITKIINEIEILKKTENRIGGQNKWKNSLNYLMKTALLRQKKISLKMLVLAMMKW